MSLLFKMALPILILLLQKKLQELGIAAFAGGEVPDRYYLRGDMIDEGGLQFVQWTIFNPQNQNTGLYTLEKLPDLAQPSSTKPQNIEEFVLHSASNIDRLSGGDGVHFAALKKPVFMCQLSVELRATVLKACLSPFRKNWSVMGLDVLPTESVANYIVRGEAKLPTAKLGT